jgi:Protein of unknown function (DUF1200).
MKYKMSNYFAFIGAFGFIALFLVLILNPDTPSSSLVVLGVVVCFAELICLFGIFRSWIILESKQLVIYNGIVKKVIPYEKIEYIKETRSMVAISRPMSYAIHNVGIRVKGPNVYGMDYPLIAVRDLDDFINEIEVSQPQIQVIRKDA